MSSTADDHTQTSNKLSRRQMLGRTAAAGAVAWSAPLILSSTAHAAGTLGGNVCGEDGNDRPDWLRFRYVNDAWIWDVCVDPSLNPDRLPDTRSSTTLSDGDPGPASVQIRFTRGALTCTVSCVNDGEEFVVDGLKPGDPDLKVEFYQCLTDTPGVDPPFATIENLHVSCSQPLCVGDTYGFLRNVNGAQGTAPTDAGVIHTCNLV